MEKTLLYVVYEKFLSDEKYSSLSEMFSDQSTQIVVTDYPSFHEYFDRNANMGALPYPNAVCLDLQGFSSGFDNDVIERLAGKYPPTVVINGSEPQMDYARDRGLLYASDCGTLNTVITDTLKKDLGLA